MAVEPTPGGTSLIDVLDRLLDDRLLDDRLLDDRLLDEGIAIDARMGVSPVGIVSVAAPGRAAVVSSDPCLEGPAVMAPAAPTSRSAVAVMDAGLPASRHEPLVENLTPRAGRAAARNLTASGGRPGRARPVR